MKITKSNQDNVTLNNEYILYLNDLGMNDVAVVGGKNASLGEMITNLTDLNVSVPGGFATTAWAYRKFLNDAGLTDKINQQLDSLDISDLHALASTGASIRHWIIDAPFSPEFEQAIEQAYLSMTEGTVEETVAVRSSATAEDLPDASFAGQQETFLNVKGSAQILIAIKQVFASLFNDRAISYRVHQGFLHKDVALSAGIQKMVRSDLACSGVMFTVDTESGFEDVVLITGSYGLGETIVQGAVNPDEFYVYKKSLNNGKSAIIQKNMGSKRIKMVYANEAHNEIQPEHTIKTIDVDTHEQQSFCLTNDEATALAKMAVTIENHYQRPMDIEWAKDGLTNTLFIVQARPETVVSRESNVIERFVLSEHPASIIEGRAVGNRIGQGQAKVIQELSQMDQIEDGDVLVTDMTDPDWEPIMKKASAIVTNRGGRTCHAAIIARELGVPALVGCGDATQKLQHGVDITVSCAQGDTGYVYHGLLTIDHQKHTVTHMPELPLKVMMNIANPEAAFGYSRLPHKGIGLARMEFIINQMIGIHPKALLCFDEMDGELQHAINERIHGYPSPVDYYVERLSEGIATLAAAFAPERVIVRLSDFKSNEYAHLLGGELFEPKEENPMIGFRGASRYISDFFKESFALECRAIKQVRETMGLDNVEIMVPFVRTLEEAQAVIALLETNGLKRGENNLKIIMMCEIPANVILADRFLEYFDGFSIGSNDLTQLTLGLDRDSALIAESFDERNPAVLALLSQAIVACKKAEKYVGICGQGPSDHPELAEWLLEQGIDSISLNPDTVVDTWLFMANKIDTKN